jgi:hypothetical protein
MVKKLEKGATVTCYKCHGEGHKFYKCPQFDKKIKEERGWNQPIWVPKEVIINMKGPQMVWVPKAT